MKSYGFTESAGDWSLGLSDNILFDKNDYKLRPESQQQIREMASVLAATGLKHARMDGHTDNYGEDSYNEALSLKRANVVADAWAEGANIPRSNLTTQGLGKNTRSPAIRARKVVLKTAALPSSSARRNVSQLAVQGWRETC